MQEPSKTNQELIKEIAVLKQRIQELEKSEVERKQMGDALRESEARFKALHNASFGGIAIHDKGVILDCNKGMSVITGYSIEELTGMDSLLLIAPQSRNDVMANIMAGHEKPYEAMGIRKNGGEYFLRLEARNVPYKGEMVRIIELRDITEQKRAEEQLQQAHERLNTVINSMEAFVYIADMKTHEILFVNDYGRKIWGNIEGMMCWKAIQKDQEGPCSFCTNDKLLDKDGNPTGVHVWEFQNSVNKSWYDCRDMAIRWIDGRLVRMEIATDITDRKQVEQKLRESEEKYRNLVENVSDVIYEIDSQGVVIYISPVVRDVMGYDQADIVGKNFIEFVYKDDRSLLIERFIELSKGIEYPLEYRLISKSGEIRWVRTKTNPTMENGSFKGAHGTFTDITGRKQSEEALRESEKQYRTLFEAIADTVFLIDQETGSLLDVNLAAIRMYGFNHEEFLRMTTTDVSAEPEKTAKATSEPVPFIPIRYHRHKDGTVFPVEITANIFELQGRKTIIATTREITERKKIEEEHKQLELQRQQLQKTESLGRMAGAIAHHFNNHLGVVIGNLEMTIDNLPQDAEPFNSLSAAMQAASKAAEMSSLMLTYLGQSFDNHEPLDLSDVCRRSLPLLKAVMPGDVTMKTDLPSPGPIIMANAPQIQQVLSNLITNAWEAIGDGRGAIHLRVKTVSPTEITAAYRSPIDWQSLESAYVCLEVTDTGCGIEDTVVEKLFDPFFSTKFTGRGLGLAAVMGIVKAHGGVVTVESEPGRGSAFRVFFPMSREEVLGQPDKAAQPLAAEKGGGTVLLVEDEEMVREVAAAMLNRLGFSVLEAKDGVEAVEVFRQHQDEIRCVLSDLTMPRMNGWETLAALRKLAPDIPVILASGYDEAHVMAGDHAELPQVFLGKPYRLKGLSDAISHALNKK